MDFKDLIQARYSVRAYQTKPVEEEKLNAVLEAARLAPTAANRQPFKILIIRTEGRKEELGRIYGPKWFTQPPLVICICGEAETAWIRNRDQRSYLDVDAAIVMDHLILAAANEGLGTCWIAAFDAEAAREILQIPENLEPLLFTPLGYAADQAKPKQRRPLSELVYYETQQ
jgi:nitroreductase